MDGPETDSSGATPMPATAAEVVGYAYTCYDDDNRVVSIATKSARTDIVYQKSGHGPAPGRIVPNVTTDEVWWNTMGWAASRWSGSAPCRSSCGSCAAQNAAA